MTVAEWEIKQDKLDGYLLNLNHVEGGPKANFFIGRGFSTSAPQALSDALAHHGIFNWPGTVKPASYGVKHVVTGPMQCPDGSSPDILAVCKVETDSTTASLVTAYPA